MNVILEHVVVICLGMLLPRRSYAQDIFGLPCPMTALLPFRSAMPARPTIRKFGCILLLFGGIDFMTCHPHLAQGHGYIILAVDYFTKWAEAMMTFDNTGKTSALFLFNFVIARFGVPQAIVTDHGSHFRNFMMSKLTKKLGLRHDNSTPYYPQANG
jgi:hypothetical protein